MKMRFRAANTGWLLLLAAIALSAPAALAQPGTDPIGDLKLPDFGTGALGNDKADPVTVRAAILPGSNGQPPRLQIDASILPGWHIYSLTQQPGGPTKSEILLQTSGAYRLVGGFAVRPQPEVHTYPYWENLNVEEHHVPVTWTAPIEVFPPTKLEDLVIRGQVVGQVCKQVCLNFEKPFEARLAAASGPNAVAQVASAPASPQTDNGSSSVAVGKAEPAATPPTTADPPKLTIASIATYLGFAFLAGLILNVMPCVLPVIGLKLMSFVQQAGEDRSRIFVLNLWYVVGLMSVFLVLATLVTVAGLAWGDQFQSPQFAIVMTGLVFAFALSLLGIWEIPLPGFVGSSSASALAEREGATGAFAKGILATLLATPCTGPFLGSTINWTLRQGSPTLTFAIFAAMGVGMGSPYLVVGAYPALIRFLPKPGAWMETFKHVMGFVLLATVVWIFYFLDPDYRVATLAIMFGIWLACWWIGRTPFTAPFGQKAKSWVVAGLIFVAVTVFAGRYLVEAPGAESLAQGDGSSGMFSGGSSNGTSDDGSTMPAAMVVSKQFGEWLPFSRVALERLKDGGVTVLVDFTAKW